MTMEGDLASAAEDTTAVMDQTAAEPQTSETTASPSAESAAPDSAAAPQQESVWSAFRTLPDFQGKDDATIARSLYASMVRERQAAQALAQYQQHIPALREFYANRSSYEQWLASQRQQQQQPAQPEKPKFWDPPQIKESWKQYLVKDENGKEMIAQDAPLEARDALFARQKYIADFARKFLDDPESAIGPMVQDIAQRQAAEIIQSQLQSRDEEQFVGSVEDEHAEWLFEDGDRNRPTAAGLKAREFVDQAVKLGIQGPKQRWNYALMATEHWLQRQLLEARSQQQAAPAPAVPATPVPQNAASAAEADMNYLRRAASRNPSRAPASGESSPSQPLTFEQMLTRRINS